MRKSLRKKRVLGNFANTPNTHFAGKLRVNRNNREGPEGGGGGGASVIILFEYKKGMKNKLSTTQRDKDILSLSEKFKGLRTRINRREGKKKEDNHKNVEIYRVRADTANQGTRDWKIRTGECDKERRGPFYGLFAENNEGAV